MVQQKKSRYVLAICTSMLFYALFGSVVVLGASPDAPSSLVTQYV